MENIKNMVDNILSGEHNNAMEQFKDIISDKISSAFDSKKIEIATSLGKKDEDHE
jgi:uncharacterized protein (UPF0335 family)